MRTFCTSPLLDFTVKIGKSTASIVPLMRISGDCCASAGAARESPAARIAIETGSRTLLQGVGDFSNAGIGTNLILLAAGRAGDADAADCFVTSFDRHAAADPDNIRDLFNPCVLGLFHQFLYFERRLAACARGVSLEAREFHCMWIGAVAADSGKEVPALIYDRYGNFIAVFRTLLERAVDDHQRHFHRHVLLALRSLRICRRGERQGQDCSANKLNRSRHILPPYEPLDCGLLGLEDAKSRRIIPADFSA